MGHRPAQFSSMPLLLLHRGNLESALGPVFAGIVVRTAVREVALTEVTMPVKTPGETEALGCASATARAVVGAAPMTLDSEEGRDAASTTAGGGKRWPTASAEIGSSKREKLD